MLRAKGAKPAERRGKVLFINADAEYRAGRAQNYLEPEHIEKIVNAYQRFTDIPGFAAVVPHAELAENDYNLNIRRYADNAPPPEPQDVRAHLLGGVPKAEVAAKAELFAAHGFDPRHLLIERDERYFDFRPDLNGNGQGNGDLKQRIEADPGLQDRERTLAAAFDAWWSDQAGLMVGLAAPGAGTQALMALRARLMTSFGEALVPVGLLDRFQIAGAVATWWNEVVYDLQTLMARGFEGVVEGWATTIVTALEEGGPGAKGADPLDHKLVKALLPEFLDDIAEAEGQVAELDGTLKAATAKGDDEEEDEGDAEEALSEAEDQGPQAEAVRRQVQAQDPPEDLHRPPGGCPGRARCRSGAGAGARHPQGRPAPGAGPPGRGPPAGRGLGGRGVVGQVPGDAAGNRRGAGCGEGAVGWVSEGAWLCGIVSTGPSAHWQN